MTQEPIVYKFDTVLFMNGQEFIDKVIEFSYKGNDVFSCIIHSLQIPISNYQDRHVYLRVDVTLAQYNQLISICESSDINIEFKNHEMYVVPRLWFHFPLDSYEKDVDKIREIFITNNLIPNFAYSDETDRILKNKHEYRYIATINLVPIDEDLVLHHVHNMIDQRCRIDIIHKFITKTGFKHLNRMLYRYCEDNDIPSLIKHILA